MSAPHGTREIILCDTTFVSLAARPDVSARWPAAIVGRLETAFLAVSVFTVGEMRAGAIHKKWGAKRSDAQEARLAAFVRIPLDEDVLMQYAVLHAWALNGNATPHNDLWIAATALSRELPLVSCDKHFSRIAATHPLEHIYLEAKP